jgi:hypothetical protein
MDHSDYTGKAQAVPTKKSRKTNELNNANQTSVKKSDVINGISQEQRKGESGVVDATQARSR